MYAKCRVYLKYRLIPNISGFLGFSKDFQNRSGLLSEKILGTWVAGRDQVLLYAMKCAGVNLGALPLECETCSLIQTLNMDTSAQ